MPNNSIWPPDKTLSGATTPGQSGPGSNGNEEVLYIPQSSTDENLSLRWFDVIYRTHLGEVLPLCRDAVGVFYSPSWLGFNPYNSIQ